MLTFFEHSFSDRVLLLTLALLVNILFGGPRWLHSLLHLDAPANTARRSFSFFMQRMNRTHRSESTRRSRGTMMAIMVLLIACIIGAFVSLLSIQTRGWMLAEVVLLAVMLGVRQSLDRVAEVRKLLAARNSEAAKRLLQPEVKQDLTGVDDYAVARAAIEYLAHRLVSGLVSPAFWYLLGGLTLALPAVAMHRLAFMAARPIPKYQAFAAFVQAVERVFRAVPTGLAVLLVIVVLPVVPGTKNKAAKTALREDNPPGLLITDYKLLSVIARSFGVALQGPCTVESSPVAYPWIGEGPARLTPPDILRMQYLYGYAFGVCFLLITALNLAGLK